MKRLQACRDVACMLLGGRKRDDRQRLYEGCRDGRQRLYEGCRDGRQRI